MVILYEGVFCRFPRKEEIIAIGAEEDWVDLVRANGIEPELDFHFAFYSHIRCFFGSYSSVLELSPLSLLETEYYSV